MFFTLDKQRFHKQALIYQIQMKSVKVDLRERVEERFYSFQKKQK